MIQYPSWKDVSVPLSLINSLKKMRPCHFLDSLIGQIVHKNKRRVSYKYTCSMCGITWEPERISEEVSNCPRCNNVQIFCSTQLKFKETIAYTKHSTNSNLHNSINAVCNHYQFYFDCPIPDKFIDVGWHHNKVYACFAGGDCVFEEFPKLAFFKAMILCPFLWDNRFDWTNSNRNDIMNVEHFTPIFQLFSSEMS